MNLYNLFNKTIKEKPSISYQVGQQWHYHTRPGEESSTLKILKIEDYEKEGTIIHISFAAVKIKNPKYFEGALEEVLHLPIAENALRKSTTKLKDADVPLPIYELGYTRWKNAFDEGKAGYFGIPLREAIQWLEDGTYEVK
ncbi:hypothetical protein [Sphingobacterium endophyticum]|uniref:hypothetical protein n=1 Tax=Sphingobacterium endophyticum TaxID=2546448 RepID=UPI0012E1B9A9|nr:hypothetical protein [Sphingobacterium endophyticum]